MAALQPRSNRMTRIAPLAGLLLAAICTAAGAQANMKPGLWEVTSKLGGNPQMDSAMAQMQARVAAMPPEQRKMMEDMLAKQGVTMAPAAGGAMLSKVCISKEMLDRGQMPMQQRGNCASSTSNASASGMDMKFTCTDPQASGQGRVNFRGDSAYDMKMAMETLQQGKPMRTTMEATGKWLGADCGGLKPVTAGK